MLIFMWILSVLLGILLVISLIDKSDSNIIEKQEVFENKLNKLLKNVTNEEWSLYKKIFHKMKYTLPEYYEVDSVNGVFFGVKIDNIYVRLLKDNNKYECSSIDIVDSFNNSTVSLTPPNTAQLELYDFFVDYIIWKLEVYYKQKEEDKKKEISEEHQNKVKKALKAL